MRLFKKNLINHEEKGLVSLNSEKQSQSETSEKGAANKNQPFEIICDSKPEKHV